MALFNKRNNKVVTTKKVIVCDDNKNENNSVVDDFIQAQKVIFNAFELGKDYHIKIFTDNKWTLNDFEDGQILRYWVKEDRFEDCVIVKENGESIIRQYDKYSIVIALDCVKTAFLFETNKRI